MNIRRKIKNCEDKISDIKSVKSEIDRQYDDFKSFMVPQEKELDKLKLDLAKYINNNTITVRFGDLLDELSKLSNINKEDIDYNIKTNLFSYSATDSIGKIIEEKTGEVHANAYIEDKKQHKFKYVFDFSIDISSEEILKRLEIVTVILKNRLIGKQYELHIVKDIENFNISISLLNLMERSSFFWPNNLLIDAVQNCINKQNIKSKVKKRGGKK